MFDGKILIGVGCSHTAGDYNNEYYKGSNSCIERSWVKKLERIGNFKDSVNLALPGGSNYRSERVLIDYIKKNPNNLKDSIVIFTVTELSRFETVNIIKSTYDDVHKQERVGVEKEWAYMSEGIWKLDNDQIVDAKRRQFLEYYYSIYSHNEADVSLINRKVIMISSLLHRLGIEHYFLEMICTPETIQEEQLGFNIPMINFVEGNGPKMNAIDWMKKKFKRGPCGHFDHDANQALAEYIHDQLIKKDRP
jgi:hypothetical protein